MTEQETCIWTGNSGTQYRFFVYPIGAPLRDEDGNYIYARVSRVEPNGKKWWTAVYIGEGNLAERSDLDRHHKGSCIVRNGATHFHCHLNADDADRLAEEGDLLAEHATACNG